MTTGSSGMAKIYTFPPRGRFAAPSQQGAPAAAMGVHADAELQPNAKVAPGSGWYHEEAIQAEQRRRS